MTTEETIDRLNDMLYFYSSQIQHELMIHYEGKSMKKVRLYASCINRINERLQKQITLL